MSYNLNSDTYTCDICGFTQKWDEIDDVHGDMWGCEVCGTTFCSKCLKDAVGEVAYMDVMQGDDLIKCPECLNKANSSLL